MKKLMTLNGHPTNADDSQRAVLHSMECGYWTDDFSKVDRRYTRLAHIIGTVLCCPYCKSVLSQVTYDEWQSDVNEREQTNPGFLLKIAAMKERCAKQR